MQCVIQGCCRVFGDLARAECFEGLEATRKARPSRCKSKCQGKSQGQSKGSQQEGQSFSEGKGQGHCQGQSNGQGSGQSSGNAKGQGKEQTPCSRGRGDGLRMRLWRLKLLPRGLGEERAEVVVVDRVVVD